MLTGTYIIIKTEDDYDNRPLLSFLSSQSSFQLDTLYQSLNAKNDPGGG